MVEKTKQPFIDNTTGKCIACGLEKNVGHAWPCIGWFMAMSSNVYRRSLLEARDFLKKLRENAHISDADVKEQIDKIEYTVHLTEELAK